MRRLVVRSAGPSAEAAADEAAAWLRGGGLVIYPTDTFYALGGDPTSAEAMAALFEWKGRGSESALPLVAGSRDQVETWFGRIDEPASRLAREFWPGPLSLVLPAGSRITPAVHAGRGTVAVRVPDHAFARLLAGRFGPVPATSANRSGMPPVTQVDRLGALLDDARVLTVDGGELAGGAPSTIVDARSEPPRLVRDGIVPWNRVLESLKE